MMKWMAGSLLSVCLATAGTAAHAKTNAKALSAKKVGLASIYSDRLHGRRTAAASTMTRKV